MYVFVVHDKTRISLSLANQLVNLRIKGAMNCCFGCLKTLAFILPIHLLVTYPHTPPLPSGIFYVDVAALDLTLHSTPIYTK